MSTPRSTQALTQARVPALASSLALLLSLAACVTPPAPLPPAPTSPARAPAASPATPVAPAPAPVPAPAPAPAPAAPLPGTVALREGVRAFELGEYRRAEQRLSEGQKLGLANVAEQLQALKTQAFLFCITRRAAPCERAFEAAFATDKSFRLSAGEAGHPLWGPVYSRVLQRLGMP